MVFLTKADRPSQNWFWSLLADSFIITICLALTSDAFAQVQKIRIIPEKTFQTIEGFGTCVIDFRDSPEMPEYFDDSLYDMAVNDLGMSMLRLSFPQPMEWKNDDSDPDHFNWPAFNMEQLNKRMLVAKAFQDRGVNKILVSTWSPPEFTKTHRSTIYGGHLRMDMYEEYAENFAAMIMAAKKNWDVNVGAIGLQNELLFIEPYKSCIYNPFQAREAVRVLQRKFLKEGINSKIIMPEEMMRLPRMKAYVAPVMADRETRQFNGALAAHRLDDGEKLTEWKEFSAPFNKQSWMTETSGHTADWKGAMELAEDIHQHLVLGNFSAWMYWQLSEGKTDVYSLMNKHTPLPKYYTSRHFYRYIRPGAVRVEAATEGVVMASAFVHPVSGMLTIVLVNNQEKSARVSPEIKGFGLPQFTGFLSTEDFWFQALKSGEENDAIEMPAKSVITLTLTDERFKSEKETEEWPQAWVPEKNDPLSFYGTMQGQPESPADYACMLARAGNLEKLQEELKTININDTVYNGWTPLHHAILAGRPEVMEYLIKNGADLMKPAAGGWTPLHMAASAFGGNGHDGQKVTKAKLLHTFLQAGPDVQVRTEEGWTALHAAVINSHTAYSQNESEVRERVKLLISAGIDVNAQDNMERTPLHWAAWQGYEQMVTIKPDVVNELLQQGAEVNAQDKEGNTALHYAVKMTYLPVIQALLEAGADVHIKNHAQETPMVLAEKGAHWQVLRLLGGEDNKVTDITREEHKSQENGKLGQELLQAAWKGNIKEVKRLLDAGADINYRDSDGFSAMDRARDGGHKKIVEMIQERQD